MNRSILLFALAGLCLALNLGGIGCNSNGPVTPPSNAGSVTITDDGDEQLITNEPVVLTWDFVPRIDHYQVSYSADGGVVWNPAGETKTTQMNWKIPTGINSTNLRVRADGYSDRFPAPQSRAISKPMPARPYGQLYILSIDAPGQSVTQTSFNATLGAEDRYGNIITDFGDNVPALFILPVGINLPAGATLDTMLIALVIQGSWSNGVATYQVPGGINVSWGLPNHPNVTVRLNLMVNGGGYSLAPSYDDITISHS